MDILQWGTDDAEIKVRSLNPEVTKFLPFKAAWGGSECSYAYFAYC